jgi:hypothetical protein
MRKTEEHTLEHRQANGPYTFSANRLRLTGLLTSLALSILVATSASAQPRMTDFEPSRHGFSFVNTFTNNFISEFDVRTGGLCGGMVYSALDYYYADVPIPRQDWKPAEGERLRDYIYARQVTSLESNLDRWAELTVNPFGWRNQEFFNWGLQGFGGGQLEVLKRQLDAGRPVPLGLRSCGDSCSGDHQVLAIGYDMGRYDGRLGAHKTDLKIFIYDPNHPNSIQTLVPVPGKNRFYYTWQLDAERTWIDKGSDPDQRGKWGWLSYFVDMNHVSQRPPRIAEHRFPSDGKIHGLLIQFLTGGDDLRGGNDNLNLTVNFREGAPRRFTNVNQSRRWIVHEDHTIMIPLGSGHDRANIKSITLETTFGGGIGGDNWDLAALRITGRGGDVNERIYTAPPQGRNLVHRFTGQQRSFVANTAVSEPTTLERNTDRPGRDYHAFWLDTDSMRSCQRQCNEDPQCDAYTYVRPGVQGPRARCYLKSGVPDKRANNCCVSGIKYRHLDLGRR